MIPIKINGKKYKIKPIAELTTAEYLQVTAIENLDYVKYIAWQTGQSLESAFFAVTSKTVEQAIGVFPDVTKLPRPKFFDYNKTISTIGQRHQVESSGVKGYDLLVFCLAVAQARSNNIDDVNKLRDQYMNEPAFEILPAGFFFLQELQQWQQLRSKLFKEAQQFDKNAEKKKAAGIHELNQFSCEYELQTVCELFPALTPDAALEMDDTFLTKHLLSKLKKSIFEHKLTELLSKK